MWLEFEGQGPRLLMLLIGAVYAQQVWQFDHCGEVSAAKCTCLEAEGSRLKDAKSKVVPQDKYTLANRK
jgi:hypothetical protein